MGQNIHQSAWLRISVYRCYFTGEDPWMALLQSFFTVAFQNY